MYKLKKTMEVAGSHHLDLPYESKCKNNHGHNWIITVGVKGTTLNATGMLIDFAQISKIVMALDHTCLNDAFPHNPTAENIAKYIADAVDNELLGYLADGSHPGVDFVEVIESKGNIACYIP